MHCKCSCKCLCLEIPQFMEGNWLFCFFRWALVVVGVVSDDRKEFLVAV